MAMAQRSMLCVPAGKTLAGPHGWPPPQPAVRVGGSDAGVGGGACEKERRCEDTGGARSSVVAA